MVVITTLLGRTIALLGVSTVPVKHDTSTRASVLKRQVLGRLLVIGFAHTDLRLLRILGTLLVVTLIRLVVIALVGHGAGNSGGGGNEKTVRAKFDDGRELGCKLKECIHGLSATGADRGPQQGGQSRMTTAIVASQPSHDYVAGT